MGVTILICSNFYNYDHQPIPAHLWPHPPQAMVTPCCYSQSLHVLIHPWFLPFHIPHHVSQEICHLYLQDIPKIRPFLITSTITTTLVRIPIVFPELLQYFPNGFPVSAFTLTPLCSHPHSVMLSANHAIPKVPLSSESKRHRAFLLSWSGSLEWLSGVTYYGCLLTDFPYSPGHSGGIPG